MIHVLQCLCGPKRHAIMAILYDDNNIAPEDARNGFEVLIEMQADHGIINRRCEMCDKGVDKFWYEDGISKEQEWDKAEAQAKVMEAAQMLTQEAVKAERKAGKN